MSNSLSAVSKIWTLVPAVLVCRYSLVLQCACSACTKSIDDIPAMMSTSTAGGSVSETSSLLSTDLPLMTVVIGAWLMASDAAMPNANNSALNNTLVFNTTDLRVLGSDVNGSVTTSARGAARGLPLNEIQLVKVVIMVIVVGILILSTCAFVLRTFSLSIKKEEEH